MLQFRYEESDMLKLLYLIAITVVMSAPAWAQDSVPPSDRKCLNRGGSIITSTDKEGRTFRFCRFDDNSYCLAQRFNRAKCRPGRNSLPSPPQTAGEAVKDPGDIKYCIDRGFDRRELRRLVPCDDNE